MSLALECLFLLLHFFLKLAQFAGGLMSWPFAQILEFLVLADRILQENISFADFFVVGLVLSS